jgi:DNA helicase-2/ATP-dependent DNA helicase PcrA
LMTIHSAKGLEFPTVFICGLEDGLFPHHFSSENKESLEEERRLCYVGITRAMQQLYLTHAEKRRLFGRDEERRVSRFIREIPEHLIQETQRKVTLRGYSSPMSRLVEETDSDYCLGQRVSHPKFGEGTIVDQEGMGERARVHVKFDLYGSKWLALAYAKLEAVE